MLIVSVPRISTKRKPSRVNRNPCKDFLLKGVEPTNIGYMSEIAALGHLADNPA